ncbi:helix-turn-helix domain-containing protein [Thiofilum flexile]|uniref:helix-turn-helix domain-containing protein n=1 Tax=Thiofilum flexile TaxID=125627 RepID=UPI00035CA82C|nr:helix-turn-helix domain-containing protein [Thiofilum flexile]
MEVSTDRPALKNGRILQRHEADDADLHASNLTGWQQEYDQLSRGRFFGSIVELSFDKLQVFREDTNRALQQKCKVWANSIWLGIPLAQQAECRINGQAVGADRVMCRAGNSDFDLSTPQDYSLYGLVIDYNTLLETARLQGLTLNWKELHESGRLQLPNKTLENARFVLARLLDEHEPQTNHHAAYDLLLMLLLELLKVATPEHAKIPSYPHRKQVVDEVRSYISAHPDTLLTITDLCKIANVSRRALQYSFASILGISPLRYLRVSRLNGVRRTLMQIPQYNTVADIASQWGFWHMSQFAKDYRELFDELPSQTLKRQQVMQNNTSSNSTEEWHSTHPRPMLSLSYGYV